MIAGTAICAVGAGLLNTLELDTGMAKWVGYQVLYGVRLHLSLGSHLVQFHKFVTGLGSTYVINEANVNK